MERNSIPIEVVLILLLVMDRQSDSVTYGRAMCYI